MRGERLLTFLVLFSLVLVVPVFADEWVEQDSGTNFQLKDVHFVNEFTGWVVGGRLFSEEDVILKTVNSGDNWTEQHTDNLEKLQGVCFANLNKGWAVGMDDTILYTETSGMSWTPQTVPVDEVQFNDVYCVNQDVIYVVGEPDYSYDEGSHFGNVLKTVDGGLNWEISLRESDATLNAVFFVSEDVGWAVGDNGNVLKTINGGLNWTQQGILYSPYSGASPTLYDVFCLSETECWISATNNILYHTIDGGLNWENESAGSMVSSTRGLYFVNETHAWAVTQNMIKASVDGGLNWTIDELISVNMMFDVQFVNGVGWAVGDEGKIFRYGEPFVCPLPSPDLPDVECEYPALAEPIVDLETNCTARYECVNATVDNYTVELIPPGPFEAVPPDECEEELEECLEELNDFMDDCMRGASTDDCWEDYAERNETCWSEYYECVGADVVDEVEEVLEESEGEEVPGAEYLGDKEINIYLTRFDGSQVTYGIDLKKNKLREFKKSGFVGHDFSIMVDEKLVAKILASENPKKEAIKAFRSGDIKIKAHGFGNKIKLIFLKVGSGFM